MFVYFYGGEDMKKINYIATALAFFCFGGAVGESNLIKQDPLSLVEQVASYFNQAHLQDQTY